MKNAKSIWERSIAVLFCLALGLMSIMNLPLVIPAVKACLRGRNNFGEMTQAISEVYLTDNLWGKYQMIDVNGLFARATGRRAYNEVTLLKNGMLDRDATRYQKPLSHTGMAEAVLSFARFLEEEDIPFLYVQVPVKPDMKGELLPTGLKNYPNQCADALLAVLNKANVWTLDLRETFASDQQALERSFYRTDHHWNTDASFIACQMIVEELKAHLNPSIDTSLTKADRWERHCLENWFLGSRGKRVGKLFAGVDSFVWYTPKFQTEMSCMVPHLLTNKKGDFCDANLLLSLTRKCDIYLDNAYRVYIGANQPLAYHRNTLAPNPLKVLLIKDSFGLSVQAHMSASFAQVDAIDPREWKNKAFGIADYCRWNRPDVVIMMPNVNSITNKQFARFGVEIARRSTDVEEFALLTDIDVIVSASNEEHCEAIPLTLVPGKTYMLTFDNITLTEGTTDCFCVAVRDTMQDKVLDWQIFDPATCKNFGDNQWVFRLPSNKQSDKAQGVECQLVFYAGTPNHFDNTGMHVSGISVEQMD